MKAFSVSAVCVCLVCRVPTVKGDDKDEENIDVLRKQYIAHVTEEISSWPKEKLQRTIKEKKAAKLFAQAIELLTRVRDDYADTPSGTWCQTCPATRADNN